MSIITVWPSLIRAAAAAPIASLASKRSMTVSSNGGSALTLTAPPRTRSMRPSRASSSRSRRTVISDTPKLVASSVTCVAPERMARRISCRRCAGTVWRVPGPVTAGGEQVRAFSGDFYQTARRAGERRFAAPPRHLLDGDLRAALAGRLHRGRGLAAVLGDRDDELLAALERALALQRHLHRAARGA